jgi:hypothetical protein
MPETITWTMSQFPVVYEGNQPKAVLVDIDTFRRLEFMLDNLLNREPEPEDVLLGESGELRQLAEWVKATAHISPDWERELDEL